MILYHFTSMIHLPSIMKDGHLKLTESNIGSPSPKMRPHGTHRGPDVVWLTEEPHPTKTNIDAMGTPKGEVRITVEIPQSDLYRWNSWAPAFGIQPDWYDLLSLYGDPDTWWLTEREIPASEWRAIDAMVPVSTVGRNDGCPCESGRKFKQCHLGKSHYSVSLLTRKSGSSRAGKENP
jgi:hypothetical protein